MQQRPVLYLMVGYPGAGKTTAARVIADLTGAVHLWADKLRLELFPQPTFEHEENLKLYDFMNHGTIDLLKQGKSVVFDTSFNMFSDRERLREIAKSNNATCRVIWVKTDEATARQRATKDTAQQPTRILAQAVGDMDNDTFNRFRDKLEPPSAEETHITLDGTKITPDYIAAKLKL